MKFDLKSPCGQCPFRRDKGGVRLHRARIIQIAGNALSSRGGDFACHKTIDHDDDDRPIMVNAQHCAGSLIFSEKNEVSTQLMRITERLGMFDPTQLTGHELVFDTIDEMLEAALDRSKPAGPRPPTSSGLRTRRSRST